MKNKYKLIKLFSLYIYRSLPRVFQLSSIASILVQMN